jgi:hypothetical protein
MQFAGESLGLGEIKMKREGARRLTIVEGQFFNSHQDELRHKSQRHLVLK